MAPDVKKEAIRRRSKKPIITRAAISYICCPRIERIAKEIASGLLYSLNEKEPKIDKKPMAIIMRTTSPESIILRIKGTHRLKFFVYVSMPLLIILPISSAIFNHLRYLIYLISY
jgi:hypothetical protein